MSRISGVDLQDNWRVDYALTRLKGIGWALAGKILDSLKIDSSKRLSDITGDELSKITAKVEEFPVEGDLLRQIRANVSRLKAIGSYRGTRHSRSLPARGQRTRTNARTKRGKRKTVGAFKKEMLAQQTKAAEVKK